MSRVESGRRAGNISSEAVFDVLRVLSRADHPLGVADLHRHTGQPTSNAHRAVSTLEEAGFAARYQGRARFVPGRMCSHLVRAFIGRYAIVEAARPALARLVALADGPATLGVRLGWYAFCALALEGRMEYVEIRRVGQASLLHEGVAPLTILCSLDDAELRRYITFASRVTGSPEGELGIRPLVRSARQSGHTLRPDTIRPDRGWVGYPLLSHEGRAVAAIAQSVALSPRTRAMEPRLERELGRIVAELQRELAADRALTAAPFEALDPDKILIDVAAG